MSKKPKSRKVLLDEVVPPLLDGKKLYGRSFVKVRPPSMLFQTFIILFILDGILFRLSPSYTQIRDL